MEDRYEIKSKIGQGGFGSVYRAYDKRMNREVAVKRINSSDEDGMLEEASRQLSKEAGALASLQHPNIITIYDVGSDDDGPYVVMELLSGSPLDDLVEKAPLTWDDFRELALQSQEALIGAQELELVHRDIKPANVMLSWLPSGKFQVKLLDFGLAKLTQRPSLQTLNQSESIFGSIFFMSPEQFERAPLDQRTDMYAMGCVYYYSLTGSHPFDGATAVEVMSAHLHHDFVPLNEARPDLPRWVCDWVMWHMNRYPDDRPSGAREALQVFVQNDKYPPLEAPPAAAEGEPAKRPRLLIPGAEPLVPGEVPERKAPPPTGTVNPITKTAPQPLVPPTGSKPSVHSSHHKELEKAEAPSTDTSVSVVQAPGQAATQESPQVKSSSIQQKHPSVGPPTGGSNESVSSGTGPQPASKLLTGTQPVSAAAPSADTATGEQKPLSPLSGAVGATPPQKKKGLSGPVKMIIAAVLALLVVLSGLMLMQRSAKNREAAKYNEVITLAAHPETGTVPMDRATLDMMLRAAVDIRSNTERETVYRALYLASSTDGTDIDAEIVRFVTERQMMDSVRQVLISQVLRRRGNPEIVSPMLDYAANTDNESAAIAAMQSVRHMVDDSHFDHLLNTLQFTTSVEMRRAAEEAIVNVLEKSSQSEQYASKLRGVFNSSVNDDARHAALRLFGRIADENSLEIVRDVLNDNVVKDQMAAISALASWRNEKGFPVLMRFINQTESDQLRGRAFDSAIRYATRLDDAQADSNLRRDVWTELAADASSSEEQEKVVRGLAVNHRDDWVIPLIEGFAASGNSDRVIDVAERALQSIRARRRDQGGE